MTLARRVKNLLFCAQGVKISAQWLNLHLCC